MLCFHQWARSIQVKYFILGLPWASLTPWHDLTGHHSGGRYQILPHIHNNIFSTKCRPTASIHTVLMMIRRALGKATQSVQLGALILFKQPCQSSSSPNLKFIWKGLTVGLNLVENKARGEDLVLDGRLPFDSIKLERASRIVLVAVGGLINLVGI